MTSDPPSASLAAAKSASAGTIIGTVRPQPRQLPGDQSAAGGAYDSSKFKFAPKVNPAELRNFVVYVDGVTSTNFTAPYAPILVETRARRVNQEGAVFSPHVLPVLVGTTVEWPNNDTIYHNVFSLSEAASFDLGLYKNGDEAQRVKFDKPGRVDVFCSIHANMNCVILVLENPYFSGTDGRNNYLIRDVPAGVYKLKVWHERWPSQIKEVTVPETGQVKVDFTPGWDEATTGTTNSAPPATTNSPAK